MADPLMIQQSALDQMWKSAEPFIFTLLKCSQTGIKSLTPSEIDVIEPCCNLMACELEYRIKQREQCIRCLVYKGMFSEECVICIKTVEGIVSHFIERKYVTLDEGSFDDLETTKKEGTVKVTAYPMVDIGFLVVLPTPNSTSVIVLKSEIKEY